MLLLKKRRHPASTCPPTSVMGCAIYETLKAVLKAEHNNVKLPHILKIQYLAEVKVKTSILNNFYSTFLLLC